ncbi:MAG: hypothetical protein HKO62_01930 [Gammaproteobacteria bacterium]|nr:hypothetical protein [Gammaproteobacteria bacterium]
MVFPALLACPVPCLADWGENWGEMIWGQQAAAVPMLGSGGLALLALACIALGIAIRHFAARRSAPYLLVALVPFVAFATGVGPESGPLIVFQNGTVADAGEVNQNFVLLEARTAAVAPRFVDANLAEIGPLVELSNTIYARVDVSGAPRLARVSTSDPLTSDPLPPAFRAEQLPLSKADCTGTVVAPPSFLFETVIFKSATGQWYGKTTTTTTIPSIESLLEADGTCTPISIPLSGVSDVFSVLAFDDSGLVPPFSLIC